MMKAKLWLMIGFLTIAFMIWWLAPSPEKLQISDYVETEGSRRRLQTSRSKEQTDVSNIAGSSKVQGKAFTSMNRGEKEVYLSSRLELLSSINNEGELEENIQTLWKDLKTLNSFERAGYTEAIEQSLAKIDRGVEEKFTWLIRFLPAIERSLDGKTTPFGESESQVFSYLVSNLRNQGADIYSELNKIDSLEQRNDLTTRLLPHLYLRTGDMQPELMETLSADQRSKTEEAMIEISAKQNALQVPALELYLGGGGGAGTHDGLIERLFSQPEWFWKNTKDVEAVINQTEPGDRKNMVIAQMAGIISRNNPEAAEAWLSQIDDQKLRESVRSSFKN
jgi:hypothetical protein